MASSLRKCLKVYLKPKQLSRSALALLTYAWVTYSTIYTQVIRRFTLISPFHTTSVAIQFQ